MTHIDLVDWLAAKMKCFIVVELRKNSTKLMNYLGGIGLSMEAKLSGYSGPFSWCEPEYVHLWMTT